MRWWWGPLCTRLTRWVGFFYSASSLFSSRVNMSLHSGTLFWFRANQFLLFLLNAACLAEKQQIPILKSASVIFDPMLRLWLRKLLVLFNHMSTCTCFIQKIYAPSSSLLQGKHLPFTPSPLRLNIFRLFVILSLTQLYRYTPEIFLFSTATFKYKYRASLRRIGTKWGRGKGQMFALK